jgi:hypothetical protein
MEFRAPREFKSHELADFSAPLLIISAKDDIFFPPQKVFPKARIIFVTSTIREIEISGKYLPSNETMLSVCKDIEIFLSEK